MLKTSNWNVDARWQCDFIQKHTYFVSSSSPFPSGFVCLISPPSAYEEIYVGVKTFEIATKNLEGRLTQFDQ